MAHDSSFYQNEISEAPVTAPKTTTLSFIRQFARTCVTIEGSAATGTIVLN
ncbi:MAG: hypothetical protein K2M87_06670 [Muribaculaceae bacterium]|nr:hypothetical protein [Muribaculaceae bacterium]